MDSHKTVIFTKIHVGGQHSGSEKYCLLQVEKFVSLILKTDEMAYRACRTGRLVRASKLEDFYCLIPKTMEYYCSSKKYGLYVNLYFEMLFTKFDKLSYKSDPNEVMDASGVRSGDQFNELIKMIRQEGQAVCFRRSSDALEKRIKRREWEYFKYVDCLFDKCARLMVVRVDLYYAREIKIDGVIRQPEHADVARLNADIARMLGNMRHKPALFDNLEGYILKLESGDERGPHVHCLLFFNGANIQKDGWYAKEIGEYWRQVIAKGEGDYWNCNANKLAYKNKALGMIHHSDLGMRLNLRYLISYLCKIDQVIEKGSDSRLKSIRRGRLPEKNMSAAGRPRQPSLALSAVDTERGYTQGA